MSKQPQNQTPGLLIGGDVSPEVVDKITHMRHIESGVAFDVSPDNPECLDQMTVAIKTLMDRDPPIENEAIRKYFREVVDHYCRESGDVRDKVIYPRTIADFYAAVVHQGDRVVLEYSETAGRGTLGKFFWSLGRWCKPSFLNWFRKNKGENAGLFYSLLMKLRILPSIEANLILEIRNLLNSGVTGQVFGSPSTYKPSEWVIDSSAVGRDVILRPVARGDLDMALANRPLAEEDQAFAKQVEEFLLRDVAETGFGTVAGIRQAMVHRFGWRNVPTQRVCLVLPALLKQHHLTQTTTNKRLKKQLKIIAKGYPKVIVPEDKLAQLKGE